MQKYRIRLKKYGSLDFYYAILRKDWKRSTIFGDMFLKILAVLVISGHRFIKDSCIVSASALTFYSVLSLVPIVALVLGIAKASGFILCWKTSCISRLLRIRKLWILSCSLPIRLWKIRKED